MIDLFANPQYTVPVKDKLINFWYYNKIYVFIGISVLAAVLWFVRPSASREETFDYCVGIVSPEYYEENQLDALKSAFEASHGKTNVLCYHVEIGAHNQDSIEISKLDIDLNMGTSKTFLVSDPKTFLEVVNVRFSEPVPVADIQELKGLGFDELSLVSRLDY